MCVLSPKKKKKKNGEGEDWHCLCFHAHKVILIVIRRQLFWGLRNCECLCVCVLSLKKNFKNEKKGEGEERHCLRFNAHKVILTVNKKHTGRKGERERSVEREREKIATCGSNDYRKKCVCVSM